MGGTILRLAAEGHRVLLLDLTDGEPTPHGSPEIRARESAKAAEILAAPSSPATASAQSSSPSSVAPLR